MNTRTASRRRAAGGAGAAGLLALCALAGPALFAAELDAAKLPPAATRPVDYARDIRPIFEASCFRCHGSERPKSRFRLDNRASALRGGEHGVDIVPGQSAQSPLAHYVARVVPDLEMPPAKRGEPLTAEQVGLVRAWIDQGATYPAEAAEAPQVRLLSGTAILGGVSVSGNAHKFREHSWMPNGVSGGAQGFEWREPLGEGRRFSAEGRFIADAHDYRLKLAFEKDEVGFLRTGFEQYRKWSDDTGGYYGALAATPFSLNQDLHLDVGRFWIEGGFTAPNYPRVTLGYEYQFRDGAKSTLQWGLVSDAGFTTFKNVYPAYKDLDEQVHIIKVDVSHQFGSLLLEDNFRGELYDSRTVRRNAAFYTVGDALPSVDRFTERTDYFQGANAFRLEKPVREWLFLSGGYLFSRLEGNGTLTWETFAATDPATPWLMDQSNEILLSRQAHVLNANALLGPWDGLSFTAGIQSDWSRQEGFGNAVIQGAPSPFTANLDTHSAEEHFALRYTRIPATVLYADARFQQQTYAQFEEATIGVVDYNDYIRDTGARADLEEYRAGVTISPAPAVLFDLGYRHTDRATEYEPRIDSDKSATSGNGYPAFILARGILTDSLVTKLVLRLYPWLKTTLKHELVSTDFDTTTASGAEAFTGYPFAGGALRAGGYDAHVYSLNAVFTRWRRLYLSSAFSYSDSRLVSALDSGGLVVPYAGGIYTALASATFALNAQSDLRATYSFSRADFSQNNLNAALPLGIRYDRHGLLAGLTRRFKKGLSASLEYGFFHYTEPTALRANDYIAHALFASLTKRLP